MPSTPCKGHLDSQSNPSIFSTLNHYPNAHSRTCKTLQRQKGVSFWGQLLVAENAPLQPQQTICCIPGSPITMTSICTARFLKLLHLCQKDMATPWILLHYKVNNKTTPPEDSRLEHLFKFPRDHLNLYSSLYLHHFVFWLLMMFLICFY